MRISRSNRGRRGFTLLEVMLVLAVAVILAAIVVPTLSRVRLTMQIEGVTMNAVGLLERARSEAGKRGVPVVIKPVLDGAERSELLVFADYHDESTGGPGSDLILTPDTDDRLITRWSLTSEGKLPVYFWSPLDTLPEGANAITGFTANPESADLPPLLVFSGNTIEDLGTMTFGLSNVSGTEMALCREVAVNTLSGNAAVTNCLEES